VANLAPRLRQVANDLMALADELDRVAASGSLQDTLAAQSDRPALPACVDLDHLTFDDVVNWIMACRRKRIEVSQPTLSAAVCSSVSTLHRTLKRRGISWTAAKRAAMAKFMQEDAMRMLTQ